jgi:hypothetical protein
MNSGFHMATRGWFRKLSSPSSTGGPGRTWGRAKRPMRGASTSKVASLVLAQLRTTQPVSNPMSNTKESPSISHATERLHEIQIATALALSEGPWALATPKQRIAQLCETLKHIEALAEDGLPHD